MERPKRLYPTIEVDRDEYFIKDDALDLVLALHRNKLLNVSSDHGKPLVGVILEDPQHLADAVEKIANRVEALRAHRGAHERKAETRKAR